MKININIFLGCRVLALCSTTKVEKVKKLAPEITVFDHQQSDVGAKIMEWSKNEGIRHIVNPVSAELCSVVFPYLSFFGDSKNET